MRDVSAGTAATLDVLCWRNVKLLFGWGLSSSSDAEGVLLEMLAYEWFYPFLLTNIYLKFKLLDCFRAFEGKCTSIDPNMTFKALFIYPFAW